jgi:hypothetical protein
MKTKTLGWIVTLGVAAAAGMASCSQPKIECQVALAVYSPYAARYTLKSQPSAECMQYVQPGDLIGMEFYHPPSADGTTYDPNKTTIAVQADHLGSEVSNRGLDTAAGHAPYAQGAFSASQPDANDFCTVPSFTSAAQQDFPAVPGTGGTGGGGTGMPPLDADSVKYEWSNLKVYVTAAAQGTQFSADLNYTENGCTIQYSVIGLWPAISCGGTDDMGNPTGMPDDRLCNPCANPDAGLTAGSGISPDFPVVCDPVLLTCVLGDAKANDKKTTATSVPQILTTPADCGTVD